MNPYRDVAMDYRAQGWLGTIPLPYREKHPPPTGSIGHAAPHPTVEQVQEWSSDGKRHNIGIRLAGVSKDYEILGIDVDHYKSGQKDKRGFDQLTELEGKFGLLPTTWISSSRVDGKSGIRYFRVPRGYAYRGKIADDIECISKGTRFAVVWPSIHPDGPTYWWFPPGFAPDREGRKAWDQQIPKASELPILPEEWHKYLTQGGMRADAKERIDIESSVQEIYDWADATFHGDDESPMCDRMKKSIEQQKEDIANEATSHDKITKAHWHIYRLAAEGHLGWNAAVNEIEAFYAEDTLERGKRDLSEVRNEIFRSRTNGLRKIKAQIDQRVNVGAAAVDPLCTEHGVCAATGTAGVLDGVITALSSGGQDAGDGGDGGDKGPLSDIPRGPIRPVDSYEMNDDGNAEHFTDIFSGDGIGPSVRYADGYGWIVWHDGSLDENPRWVKDEFGDQEIRRMWQEIKKRQIDYVDNALYPAYITELNNSLGQGTGPSPAAKAAKAKYEVWKKFAQMSGNNRNAMAAIQAVRSIPMVSISVNELDQSQYLLGVANGVVELDNENVRLRKALATDLITFNTNVPWEKPSKFAAEKWQEYLDTFLPDKELQRTTQIALGHCLIGGNPEKIMLVLKGDPNTGKSTMLATVQKALGDYAEPVNNSIFQNHKLNPVLASALNKRIIVCSEFGEEDELSGSMVKQLTGGTDEIRAEIKNSNAKIVGIPQFVPILATNEVPKISGPDKALQNRLRIIPFNVVPDRIDKRAANVVTTVCATACLNWLIEGFIEYRRVGKLATSEAIEKETKSFFKDMDPISMFLDECTSEATNPLRHVSKKALHERYERWWMENGFRMNDKMSMPAFSRRVKALGGKTKEAKFRVNGELNHWWIGIKLTSNAPNVIQMPDLTNAKTEKEVENNDNA